MASDKNPIGTPTLDDWEHLGKSISQFEPGSPEYNKLRIAQIAISTGGFPGVGETIPRGPCGHAYGIHKSSFLTSEFRTRLRRGTVDAKPEELVDCIIKAGIKQWVLMGLHGYVGYLAEPRATQDIDLMVAMNQKEKTTKAIAERWPTLERESLPAVVRFMDPSDRYRDGRPKPVIEVMLPANRFQETILSKYVVADDKTGYRYPTLEAALASKYAAIVSPNRELSKKEQDAVDFRQIVRHNHETIDSEVLKELGDQIWDKGGNEIVEFVTLTLLNKPLPV